jgi:hypothetical protein
LSFERWALRALIRRQPPAAYHPSVLLKIYIYGYLNRVQSSRRLEHETQRNIELTWLTGRLMPESSIIVEYLMRRYPGTTRMIPVNDDAALTVRFMDRFFDNYVMSPMQSKRRSKAV